MKRSEVLTQHGIEEHWVSETDSTFFFLFIDWEIISSEEMM